MSSIHFFTETSKLKTQSPAEAYGAVSTNLNTQYRTTLKGFLSADAKAIAVCQCKVYLQPGANSNLVNAVLVPVLPEIDLNTGYTPVRYFIYRGLKKSDILDGNNEVIAEDPTNNNDLVDKLWTNFNTLKSAGIVDSGVTKPSSKALGWQYAYDPATGVITPATNLMEEVIYETNNDYEVISVFGGTEIGEFVNGNEGFEIVLAERMYLPDLANIRAAETVIPAGAPGGGDIPGNEAIANMRKREDILNYVDPVAWYNLFHDVGIYELGNTTAVKGFDNIYTTFLQKFATKNTLYIDIRNENGYSLNYYKDNEGQTSDADYGKHVELAVNGSSQNGLVYYTNYWPILTTNIPANTTSDFNTLRLKFRKLYNLHPLIYADFAHEQSGNQLEQIAAYNKFKEEGDSANPTAEWSEEFVFDVPNLSGIGSSPTQAAWIIKLMNISLQRSTAMGIPVPTSVITKNHFMDNTFGPLEPLPAFTGSISTQWTASIRKKFIISPEFAGMYQVTTAVDSQNVGYYISRLEVYTPPNTSPIGVGVSDAVSMNGGSSIEDKAMKPFEEYQSDESNYNVFRKTLVNSGVSTEVLAIEPHNKVGKIVPPGGIGSLLITRAQHSSMLSAVVGLNRNLHDILFQFQTIPPITASRDDNGQEQYDIPLQLVGLDNSGIYTTVSAGISVKGATAYNLKSLASVISAFIKNQDEVKNYEPIQLAIDEVSSVYQNQLGLDANAAETVTRINAHHFGFPGKGEQAPAFMKASTNSPYFEGPTCSIVGLPKSAYLIIYPPLGCKLREIHEEDISEDSFEVLTTSNLIMIHNGIPIDFGHAFVGLNFLLHEGKNGTPDLFFQNIGINKGLDLVSFIGDIASALAAAYNEDSSPSNSLIDAKYSSVFPQIDLYGDIDAFGLKSAYDEVLATNSNAKFSEVFVHYYSSTVPTNQNSHYTKRFTNFATEWGLIDSQGGWLGSSFPQYNDWVQRIKDIFQFLYLSRYDTDESYNIGIDLWFDTDIRSIDVTEAPTLAHNDVIYVIDKFLNTIQTAWSNE